MRIFRILFIILFSSVSILSAQSPGEEKIQDMKDKIESGVNEPDKKETHPAPKKEYRETTDEEDALGWTIFKAVFRLFFEVMSHVRYGEYPYSVEGSFHYADFVDHKDEEHINSDFDRIMNFNIDLETAYLGNETFSLNNRFRFNLSALHFNMNQQSIWSGSQYFNSLSFNLGLNLSIKNFQFSTFMGAYELNWPLFHHWFPSLGFSSMIFFPANVWLDYYGHFAIDKYITINMHELSLNYSIDRFSIGAGYVYYDYAGIVFRGPLIRFSLWI